MVARAHTRKITVPYINVKRSPLDDSAPASTIPTRIPRPTWIMVRRNIPAATRQGSPPSAMRTPTSRLLRSTVNASTE